MWVPIAVLTGPRHALTSFMRRTPLTTTPRRQLNSHRMWPRFSQATSRHPDTSALPRTSDALVLVSSWIILQTGLDSVSWVSTSVSTSCTSVVVHQKVVDLLQLSRSCVATSEHKLFTPLYSCKQILCYWLLGVMLCGWKDNHEPGIALPVRYIL